VVLGAVVAFLELAVVVELVAIAALLVANLPVLAHRLKVLSHLHEGLPIQSQLGLVVLAVLPTP
jgi:hypothetical protein